MYKMLGYKLNQRENNRCQKSAQVICEIFHKAAFTGRQRAYSVSV
jgi:hypothetical protein